MEVDHRIGPCLPAGQEPVDESVSSGLKLLQHLDKDSSAYAIGAMTLPILS